MSGINHTLSKDQRLAQNRARGIVNWAKRRGSLNPPTDFECVDCGKPARVYDHRDYGKPLDVVPVCQGCNVRRGAGKPVAPVRPVKQSAGYVVDRTAVQVFTFEAIDLEDEPAEPKLSELPGYVEELSRQFGEVAKPSATPATQDAPQLWTAWR